jgi:tetratricopeptide (TPR) repeat protein
MIAVMATAPLAQVQQGPEKMSFWQARRVILASGNYMFVPGSAVIPDSVAVTRESIEFDTGKSHHRKHYRIDLKSMEPVVLTHCQVRDAFCHLEYAAGKKFGITSDPKSTIVLGPLNEQNARETLPAIHSFADALNSLHALADSRSTGDFHRKAAAWRALPTKPPVAEGARLYRLAAEDAIKNQRPLEALNAYELGVELDPTWAPGWFNAAIVASQLGDYAEAAEHMQNYLELMPDAPDAQSARDRVDLWRFKAGQAAQ